MKNCKQGPNSHIFQFHSKVSDLKLTDFMIFSLGFRARQIPNSNKAQKY